MFQICPKTEAKKEIFERKISRINSIHYTHTQKRSFKKKRKREKERKEKEKSVRDDCVVVVVFVLRALVFEDEY